jgi:Putative  PD-(D/E)XK family member, (DUF4420)
VFEAGLEAVVSIFRSLQQPAEKTIQGLWGELALIAWAAEPVTAVSAWHSSPRALHDFGAGDDRVEVKSTTRAVREHTFRLEQLIGGVPAKILVVSMILVEREDGASVNDLVETIRSRVGGGEPARRLEAVVASSIGRDWREADEVRYDLERAREDVRFYWATQIPTPSADLPPAVKDVRFTVDLSSVQATLISDARGAGPLAAAMLPTA